ncbi:trafficking protein particle complex subunit 8 isoform X1 [Populus alba x Populus x berolinensis]|nr:trafficking protein particle complex subunit 8 isoform X1 [Populus alba x Populus x berolinensis]
MDPAKTSLGKMLLEEITPVVMVLRTPLVEESCLKNSLSFIEMLSPFCDFNNIDVPVRTSSDQPYRLQKFKLRLFYESDIKQPDIVVAKERLKQVITEAGEKDRSDLSTDPLDISNILASSKSEISPSWFEIFNKELVRTVSFSEHEAFDHPVACVSVVSSKDEQPINKFVDLFNTNKLPSLLNDGAMDPKILKHYVLVHDNKDGSSEKATKILTEMKNTFGFNGCHLLCINSSQDEQIEHQDNPWAPYKFDSSPSQDLGHYLNIDDFNEIKDLIQELSSKHIIPYMEQRVRVLNQQISATRKGFRNQIKNLWWRKGKEDTPDSSNGPMYTYSSVESQIRVLGDYAFMLGDYELALSNYRLISTDYKIDKAWKRYAGVQEMMGLTYFMLDQSRKEADNCMENAFNTYLKLGSSGRQYATRCGLWWIEMLKMKDQFKEAATVYFRICSEELLHSAVMLEQASYCYLLSQPPMLHKYGFHLVLSGDRYKKCDQIKHAIRTYRNAVSVYKGTPWSYIKDHVHFHIGQCYGFLGMYDVAFTHMLEVLACSHQSKATQELFLREFLQIVQKAGKTFEVLTLQLPVINTSSLKVDFEDHRTYALPGSTSVKESVWRSLEEDMIPSLPTARTNWLELQSKLLPKHKESNICVAGEAIKIAIEFKNPLEIPISISSVSLICELSATSDETNSDASCSTAGIWNNEEHENLREIISDTSSFSLSEVNISLGGGEANLVQLTVTPKVEGILKIVGVRWKLSGSVVGFYSFGSNYVKKKIAKGRRKAKQSPSNYLEFIVIQSLPKLEGFIHALPEKAYAGHLQHLVLELRNRSEVSVKNLKMKTSHPRFLNIGKQEDLDLEFPACLEKKTNVSPPANPKIASHGVFLFPEDLSVQGENPLLWPLWFRAAVPGNISLQVVIYYEMGDLSSAMRYRILRMHYNLQVLPSLDVSFKISPYPTRLQEFLVHMDVVNKTNSESIQVNQLSTIGSHWEISLLQPIDTIFPSQSLIAGQAFSCFFVLKNCRKSLSTEESTSSLFPHIGSNVSLVPDGSKGAPFDTSKSPLAGFHDYERLQHGISNKEAENAVDFILISRPLKSNAQPGVADAHHVFSHHACHCSTASTSPITWVVDGPRTRHHNFSSSFCEINFRMTIYNSSNALASIVLKTLDSTSISDQLSDEASGNQVGWHDVSLAKDSKIESEALRNHVRKSLLPESVSPFIWSGSSSTGVQIKPLSTTEIPLQICVFSPGTYDLSNYVLNWNLQPVKDHENVGERTQSSGTSLGYPYYLTVLPSD